MRPRPLLGLSHFKRQTPGFVNLNFDQTSRSAALALVVGDLAQKMSAHAAEAVLEARGDHLRLPPVDAKCGHLLRCIDHIGRDRARCIKSEPAAELVVSVDEVVARGRVVGRRHDEHDETRL